MINCDKHFLMPMVFFNLSLSRHKTLVWKDPGARDLSLPLSLDIKSKHP